ncbi:MAG TPA: hypothetical protein VG963_24335 [Polyangiaceae bacterium]|nr:hypothetical protein [Polyangiaceae bacterium]
MKTFLAVYTGNPALRERFEREYSDPAKRKALEQRGIAAWGAWVQSNQASIEAMGGPLGKTKRVGPDGISDVRNNLAGYTLVRAESHEAAAALFRDHPHFSVFPGEAVEVMEVLPVPGAR